MDEYGIQRVRLCEYFPSSFLIFYDSFHINYAYLSVYQTDLRQLCKPGRTIGVDDQSKISLPVIQGTLPRGKRDHAMRRVS